MRFEDHELPDNGDLVPLFRAIAARPFVAPRGDVGDQSAFDWVQRLYKEHPEWRDHVDDAFAALLTAEDPMPQRVLAQLSRLPVRSFYPRLLGALQGHVQELRARHDVERNDGRTLLGSIVYAAVTLPKSAQPSLSLAHELASLDRVEDGWPFTFFLALPGDIQGLVPRCIGVLQNLNDVQLKSFIDSMMADGTPWTDTVFDEIARGPVELRDRIARMVRSATEEMEASRKTLAMMTFDDDPELQKLVRAAAQKPNPWPQYAARLGVDPS